MNNFKCLCLNLTENKHRNELPGTAIIALLRRPGKARCVHRGEEFQLCNYRNKFATLITTGTLCSTSQNQPEGKTEAGWIKWSALRSSSGH